MTTSLDDVLSGAAPQEPNDAAQQQQGDPAAAAADQSTTGDAAPQTDASEAATPSADENADASATPAQQTGSMVPLKALEEERKGRQDWKEKAIRAEAALEALRTQQPQPQAAQAQQPVEMDLQTVLLNERFNNSEMLLRAKHDDVDEMVKVFQSAVAKNPALGVEMGRQVNPYGWMYDQAKRIQAMEEIGSDPAAYRQKLRDELMAELQAKQAQASTDVSAAAQTPAVAAQPVIPKTLATARSAAPRSAPTWTGPTSLSDILNSKR